MLLNFSLGNFRSFNQVQTIDFRATGLVSENKDVDENNIVGTDGDFIKVAGVYGANASGKSNIIIGLHFVKSMIVSSLDSEKIIASFYSPFRLLADQTPNKGYFQVTLIIENKRYRYGFTLQNEHAFAEEWLFGPADKNDTFYFKRQGGHVEINKDRFPEGHNIPLDRLRPDTLFLTFVSSYNGSISKKIRSYFDDKVIIENEADLVPGLRRFSWLYTKNKNQFTNELLKSGDKAIVLNWLKNAGLFYEDIDFEENAHGSPSDFDYEISLFKNVYNSKREITNTVKMLLIEDESSGTQKFYSYIGRLYKLFSEGGIFAVDEIDGDFHPSLLLRLIGLFNNQLFNAANAQLLFTSHDTNLLDPNVLRRDQIYFTEKSLQEESVLYSLADLKGIRNNADFARQYLAGLYGALPVLDNYLTPENSLPKP